MSNNIDVSKEPNYMRWCFTCGYEATIQIYLDSTGNSIECKAIWMCLDCANDLAKKIGETIA